MNTNANTFGNSSTLLSSPTALAFINAAAQLIPQNGITQTSQSPLFAATMPMTSSPSSSSTSSTPLPINGLPSAVDPGNSLNSGLCAICSDKATGRHYGCVSSCDGCKGFFRRSIRKAHCYKCRFNGHCVVEKSNRNSCRACRLSRCIASGMRADAIQNERDVIGKRRRIDEEGDRGAEFLKRLLDSEKLCIQLRDSVIKTTGQVMYDKGKIKYEGNERIATLDDVGASIHQRLVLTVEWAKSLHEFSSLPLDDQASLLKANATPLIVLGVALRSLHAEGGIWLANDKMLTADSSYLVGDINAVVSRIIKVLETTKLQLILELVIPLRDLEIDPTESVALKAVLFFNPYNIACTSNETVESLKKTRLSALNALRSSLKNNTVQSPQIPFNSDDECRFGQLLLLLPNVLAVAQQVGLDVEKKKSLIEDVQLCRLFNLTEIDELMQALILHEPERSGSEIIVEQLIATSEATSAFHGDI
ncbi:hypothetical protein M3Y98_00494000 [Aphelenchoides besseyi]|nr:hypothetical protein M3Y98_00494000 [Aphelenchoides besseyi]